MTGRRGGIVSIKNNPRGFALLIVLWTMVLLALLVTHLTATGHSEAKIAGNFAANAAAEAYADGVIYEGVFRVMDGDWLPDGTVHDLKLAHGTAKVRLLTESGKINPNSASIDVLAALMRALGTPPEQAVTLAEAIAAWREPAEQARPDGGAEQPQYRAAGLDYGPPNAPFESLDELSRILGMPSALAEAMKPHLSLYTFGDPDQTFADPIVLQAMKQLPQSQVQQALPAALTVGLETMSVVAEAHSDSGGVFTRRAILRIGPAFEHGYQLIEWNDGPAS
jgi:general secretion pathway protein K